MTIRSFACIGLPGKRTRKFPILIAAILVLVTHGVSHAQLNNPLRFGKTQRHTTEQANAGSSQHSAYQPDRDHSTAKSTMPPEVFAAIYNANVDRPVDESAPIVDQQVAPASYEATPKNDLAPITRMLESLPNQTGTTNQASRRQASSNNLGRNGSLREPAADPFTANPANELAETDSGTVPAVKKFDREKFQTLIKHLAINTGIVMCCGIGFILIAKQFFKGKSPGKSQQLKPGIEITSTLKLSPKSNLHLIEAGDQRLIVAMDQNGIRSVVRLTESFAHTLDSLEDLVTDSGSSASDSISSVMGAAGAVEVDDAGTYSLGAIGQSRGQSRPADAGETRIPSKRPIRGREESDSANDREAEVRRQMEAALSDHGLKELFLETLRKQ